MILSYTLILPTQLQTQQPMASQIRSTKNI